MDVQRATLTSADRALAAADHAMVDDDGLEALAPADDLATRRTKPPQPFKDQRREPDVATLAHRRWCASRRLAASRPPRRPAPPIDTALISA